MKYLILLVVILSGLISSFACAEGAFENVASPEERAAIAFWGERRVGTFDQNETIFTNREYQIAQCPDFLKGLPFLVSSIDSVSFKVLKDGELLVLTPYENAKFGSQTAALKDRGFSRLDIERFQLFGDEAWNRVEIFKKKVTKGQNYRFGKYVIVLGFSAVQKMPSGTAGEGALNVVSQEARATIAFRGECRVGTFDQNETVFSNREYQIAQCPDFLRGLPFLVSSIDSISFKVLKEGELLILTPYEKAKFGSQTAVLKDSGFSCLDIQRFQLFGDEAWNRVEIFKKKVKKGQNYRFGKYVIVLGFSDAQKVSSEYTGELLYNGIRLSEDWPPRDIDPTEESPMPIPYLDTPPKVIPVDIGRQLFVDDFLIEQTDLKRVFHKPEKYQGNPILSPETELEMNVKRSAPYFQGRPGNAAAVPKSGGIWWNPEEKIFEMWYEAGWIGTVAYATSSDGLHWNRPNLDIVPGTNQVLPPDLTADSWTVTRDWTTTDPQARWKMFIRHPGGFESGLSLTSPDGIHWTKRAETGVCGDRSTHFYNPFRKKWIYSIRSYGPERGRSREYYECDDFMAEARWTAADKVPWLMTDNLDSKDYLIKEKPQLYNFDAVAYESLMLGFFEIHYGPPNQNCEIAGLPKITELMFAYSRDGFHWSRPDRHVHICAERKDAWDRGYVQSTGNICTIRGDKLWFYYSGFRGNESKKRVDWLENGMYDRGSTGVAFLRRDGFVSMDAEDTTGNLMTRPLTFSGRQLFVNADVLKGVLRVEIRDLDGNPITPFTIENSIAFTGDSTLEPVRWKNAGDLSVLAGKPVRLFFELTNGSLYAFWISRDSTGRSDGYVAGGGPGYTGPVDTVGKAALKKESQIIPMK